MEGCKCSIARASGRKHYGLFLLNGGYFSGEKSSK